MATPKQAAKELIEHLPDQATWDDIMCELYVKQKIGRVCRQWPRDALFRTRASNIG